MPSISSVSPSVRDRDAAFLLYVCEATGMTQLEVFDAMLRAYIGQENGHSDRQYYKTGYNKSCDVAGYQIYALFNEKNKRLGMYQEENKATTVSVTLEVNASDAAFLSYACEATGMTQLEVFDAILRAYVDCNDDGYSGSAYGAGAPLYKLFHAKNKRLGIYQEKQQVEPEAACV